MIRRLEEPDLVWDVIVIGGGASGLGIAIEAVTRGYRTLLLERSDFAKGTSSRSTKLIHGGVRYLAQGNVSLVMEALRERGILKRNAAHLVKDIPFVIPCYSWWDILMYTVGLTLYDLLAGRRSIGRSVPLSRKRTMKVLPSVKTRGLRGGLLYHDCQFDDARLAIDLCHTLAEKGGILINYMEVKDLLKVQGRVTGVNALDHESGREYSLKSRFIVNATGVFVNDILRMDCPACSEAVVPSQGIHLVTDAAYLDGTNALMIPRTSDGRVLFAIPWKGKTVIGTTDIQKDTAEADPRATEEEIQYILDTCRQYLKDPLQREDVCSVFAGLRPLAAPSSEGKKTKEISRGHRILVSGSGLMSLTGGKWTTYRKIGEDVIDRLEKISGLTPTRSVSRQMAISSPGIRGKSEEASVSGILLSEILNISGSDVKYAVRHEMARTLEDVLARRTRALQLDAAESIRMAPAAVALMAPELGKDKHWEAKEIEKFTRLAKEYQLN